MKNLTEFLESNCELQEDEMKQLNRGSDLAYIGYNVCVATAAGAAGGFDPK